MFVKKQDVKSEISTEAAHAHVAKAIQLFISGMDDTYKASTSALLDPIVKAYL